MLSRLEIVALLQQPPDRRTQPKLAEHRSRDKLPVRFLHFLIRGIGEIGSLDIRNRDQFCIVLRRRAHLLEHRVGAAIEAVRLALKSNAVVGNRIQPLRIRHRQRPQQQRIDQPEGTHTSAHRQRQRQHRSSRSHLVPLQLPPAKDYIRPQTI